MIADYTKLYNHEKRTQIVVKNQLSCVESCNDDLVATIPFCRIHGLVGQCKQLLAVRSRDASTCNTQASSDGQRLSRVLDSKIMYVSAQRLSKRERALDRSLRQKNAQLLAAIAGGYIERALGSADKVPDCAQDSIASLVSVIVVNRFEVVEINKHQ